MVHFVSDHTRHDDAHHGKCGGDPCPESFQDVPILTRNLFRRYPSLRDKDGVQPKLLCLAFIVVKCVTFISHSRGSHFKCPFLPKLNDDHKKRTPNTQFKLKEGNNQQREQQ